jgi:hypothetical protein
MALAEPGQAQVRVRAAADHGHAARQLELALHGVGLRVVAEREDQSRMATAAWVMRGRVLHLAAPSRKLCSHRYTAAGSVPFSAGLVAGLLRAR